MNKALIVIDMQNEFYNRNAEVFDNKIIPSLLNRIDFFRKNNLLIIHIITEYSVDKSDWPLVRKSEENIYCLKGTTSANVIKGFEQIREEPLIIKKRYSAFYNTELEALLRKMNIDQVCLSGYSSDVCIRMTGIDAYNIGFDVVLLEDSMDSDHEDFDTSIQYLQWLIKAKIG